MFNYTKLTTIVVLFLTISFGGISAAQEQVKDGFTSALTQFERGVNGSKKAAADALEQFRLLSEQQPDNPLYLAYYGSSITIRGRDAWMPWTRLKLGDQGLDIIGTAVKMLGPAHDNATAGSTPLSLATKLVAASTFLKMPDTYFHHFEAGRNLLAEMMQSRLLAAAPRRFQARVYALSAMVAAHDHQAGEELRLLKRQLELEPQGQEADAARARLKELSQ